MIDTIILDVETLHFRPQALVLSAIFSILLIDLNLLTPREMIRYNITSQCRGSNNMANAGNQANYNGTLNSIEDLIQIYSNFLSE